MRTYAGGDHTDPLRPLVRAIKDAETLDEKVAALTQYASEHESPSMRISHLYCDHPDTSSAKKKCRAERTAELFAAKPRSPAVVTPTAIIPTPPQHVVGVAKVVCVEARRLHPHTAVTASERAFENE